MEENKKYLIDKSEIDLIHTAFKRSREHLKDIKSREERRMEDIFYGETPTFMETPLAVKPEELEGSDAAILGVPYEGITIKSPSVSAPPTVSRPEPGSVYWRMGGDKAPESIRKNSLFYSVHHNRGYFPEIDDDLVLLDNLRIVDYGDVKVVPEDTQETLRRISEKVSDIVKARAVPVVFGGDHTIPYPVLKAILEPCEKKIGLIVFDSHLDLSYEPAYWASSQWLRSLEIGKISPKNFIQIGIRGARNSLYEKKVAEALGHRIFTIDEVKENGIKQVMHESIALACEDTQGIYVSIDIDVMEPGLVPAQKAPEFWGLTTDEMIPALRMVSKENILGFDICELTPDYDINGMGAQFAARCAVEILCGLALQKRG